MKNIAVVAGFAALGIYLMKKYQNPPQEQIKPTEIPNIFPLKKGDNNTLVKNVQKALINRGGEVSRMVLSDGGASGDFNEQTERALSSIGYPVQLDKETYTMLIAQESTLRNVAYVIDVDGTDLFTEVANSSTPEYGYGRDPLTHVPVRTYLGTSTGNFKNGMVEIITNINVKRVKFWIPTEKISMVSSKEYEMLKSSQILPKSDKVKAKLLKL